MIPIRKTNFTDVFTDLCGYIKMAKPMKQERWQGKDVSNDPSATCYELRNVVFDVGLDGIEHLTHWGTDIEPNLPWADDHFQERVGGEPLNPGVEWANWPWAASADKHREPSEIFNHNYMERLWPKWAHIRRNGGVMPLKDLSSVRRYPADITERRDVGTGIAHELGDLWDLVELIANEPTTRQAFIPLFFPEDTGIGDGGRKPCTLGYQFTVRNGKLHIFYPMRSVDLVRHLRDDIYMAVRLLLWVLDRCREINPEVWNGITPGDYSMWITSLHIFQNDYLRLQAGEKL